jgi:diacylglycerol kinase (ATP)
MRPSLNSKFEIQKCTYSPAITSHHSLSTLFLINPKSAKVRKKGFDTIRLKIEAVYYAQYLPVEVRAIDFSLLDEWLQTAYSQGVRHVFAVGGDGTANAVGTRLLHSPLCFGIIPLGSGNGLARFIGFSTDLDLAIRQSVASQTLHVDTGIFGSHPFLNVAGVGMDAEVAAMFASSKMRGPIPYIYYTTRAYLSYQAEDYDVWVDGKYEKYEKVLAVGIINGTQWGYDARISPESYLSDGYLEFLVVKKMPFPQVLFEAGKLFIGDVSRSYYIRHQKCKSLIIKRKKEGNAQVDGEAITESAQIECKIIEKSLKLLLPATITPEKQKSL